MNLGIPPTTLTLPRSTWHKHKRSSVYSPMIDATNKNSKVIIEAMDRMNVTQIKIEYHLNKT